MGIPEDVKRQQVSLDPDEPDGDSIRVYFSPSHDAPPMPSVTTIKSLRVDPEKDEALQGWRHRYDGQSQYARPWWKDQKVFKGYRGTLIHFTILDELADASGDTYFHEAGDSGYGHEEYYAEYALKKWSKRAPSARTDEVPYTPRKNRYDGEHAWDRATRDMQWAARAFHEAIMQGTTDSAHFDWDHDDAPACAGDLSRGNVIGVEEYVFDTDYGYGGQFDLLYESDDGKTVLADLKASSAIRLDHKLQSAAYKRAIESTRDLTVDECAIIRLDPDNEVVEVSRSPDWDRSLDGLEHQFLGLADQAWNVDFTDALDRARVQIEQEYTEHGESRQTELDTQGPSTGNTTAD